MRNVAAQAGVSASTVTRALHKDPRIPRATRLAVQRAARRLGYRLNPAASSIMSHIRRGHVAAYRGALAWLNCEPSADAWKHTPWLKRLFEGARQRAEETGFLLEYLWLADPRLGGDHVHAILKARGVQGLIVPKPSHYPHQLPHHLAWKDLACVTISSLQPPLPVHEVGPDEMDGVRQAFTALRARGYRRIGLLIHDAHDSENQGACRAGYLLETGELPPRARLPVLMLPENADEPEMTALFGRWLDRYKADVVICSDEHVLERAGKLGLRVPDDLGIVHLDRHDYLTQWAGIDQQKDQIGAAAVDLVAGQMTRGEFGLPSFRKRVLIAGRWVDGGTVRPPTHHEEHEEYEGREDGVRCIVQPRNRMRH